jgi:phosphatidylglycerol:prolipoprotein diacylglycerol transferase
MYPILARFHLFGQPVVLYSYGAMLLTALFAGIGLTLTLAQRAGIDWKEFGAGLVWVALAALVGARLLGVITNFEAFSSGFPLSFFNLRIRGVVAYGGFMGGFLALGALAKSNRWPAGQLMDLCAVGTALGIGITRLGCFLSGCCFGCPTDRIWGVRFPADSPAYSGQLAKQLIPSGAAQTLPVHPVQLYESAFGFFLLVVLLKTRNRRPGSGRSAAIFFGLYAVFRFFLEYFRCDAVRGVYFGLSTSQYIAMATAAAAFSWLFFRRR